MKGSNFPNKSISVAIIAIMALFVINNVYSPNNINQSAYQINQNNTGNTNNSFVGNDNTRTEVRQKKLVLFDLEFEKGNLFEKFTNPTTFTTPFSKYIKSITAGEKDLSFSHEYIYSFEGVPQLATNLFQNLSKLPKKSERGNPLFVFPVLSFACNKEGIVDVAEIEEMNGASTQTKELMCTDISKFIFDTVTKDDLVVLRLDYESVEHGLLDHLMETGACKLVDRISIKHPKAGVTNMENKINTLERIQAVCGSRID